MGKIKKFKQYNEDNDGFPKIHKVEKGGRQNNKYQIEQVYEEQNWEDLEDDTYEERSRIRNW